MLLMNVLWLEECCTRFKRKDRMSVAFRTARKHSSRYPDIYALCTFTATTALGFCSFQRLSTAPSKLREKTEYGVLCKT